MKLQLVELEQKLLHLLTAKLNYFLKNLNTEKVTNVAEANEFETSVDLWEVFAFFLPSSTFIFQTKQ